MPTLRLTLEYDGTDFEGWQAQTVGHRTVQGTLEAALTRVTGASIRVVGAGRTDSGVHALGQVASFRSQTSLPPERLMPALNGVLPPDLAVTEARRMPDDFDARRGARAKLYRYALWNGGVRSPLHERRWLCLQRPLDVSAMRRAAESLEGTHDFASFQASGSGVRTTERTIHRLDVEGEAGGPVQLQVEGTGFLRHMVRILAGTLAEVGSGRRDPDTMAEILAARSRPAAGRTAPSRALTLVRVSY